MSWKPTRKALLLLFGDVVALYLSLFVALILRDYHRFSFELYRLHLFPFTLVFLVWLIIFYIAGLYDLKQMRNNLEFFKTLFTALALNVAFSISFFYLVPLVGTITPKTNLFLFLLVFLAVELSWRPGFNRFLAGRESRTRVLLVGTGEIASTINTLISTNPQLGHEVVAWLHLEGQNGHEAEELQQAVSRHAVDLVLLPRSLKFNRRISGLLYRLFSNGIEVREFSHFYEQILRKVPLSELEESWFLENLTEHQKFYDPLKEVAEFFLALVLQIVLLPLEVLIALLIKLTSPGPIIFAQRRVGKNGTLFTLYKFRSMRVNADRERLFDKGGRDERITPIGRILRPTHLDELPQLWNIVRGQLSFVGPRAEWDELAKVYEEEVPHYAIRQLVKPGLTGWAQIHYRPNASIEDTKEKLQYDLFYIKNRSVLLDIAIVFKTIKLFIINPR